ncbi:MAG: T9SS type A sorting domain-containing protein [Ignavibacteria bacterium]|nr:T9SS type A sorting domain-containing protein [Ignavibacteria bacterium]
MKNYIKIFLMLVLISGRSYSQYTNVLITNTGSPNEPSICINPKNTNIVVAGANLNFYFYSTNSGLNWTKQTLTSTYSVWGDPSITVDTAGNFYYGHLTNPSGGYFIDRIVVQKSTNGGVNWNNGSFAGYIPPKQQDKEWLCVDPANNNLYMTWTQFDSYGSSNSNDSSTILFSKSTDAGTSWSTALRINKKAGDCIDEDNTVEGAVPCVGPNGEIYTAWSGPLGIVFDKSTDRGLTWLSEDKFVTTQPGGWDFGIEGIYRANGLPITACDLSNGPNRGTIYINWSDQRNGTTDTDVWLIKSTDGGNTWSNVKRVNDDPAGRQQFFTWMTIDQATGYLYFVFYDRRNYSNTQTDVFMARSTDGGETFNNFKVSATPFTPNSSSFFGDYSNITAHNGKVRPIWTRLDNSTLSLYTAIVDFVTEVTPVSSVSPMSFKLYDNYPNPFNPSTKIKFDVISTNGYQSKINLTVYDSNGREVQNLINGYLNEGTYETEWKADNFATGVYFVKLVSDNFSETKTMMLVKINLFLQL